MKARTLRTLLTAALTASMVMAASPAVMAEEAAPAEETAEAAEETAEAAEETAEAAEAGAEEEDEENYLTGDASMDDPLNQDEIGEKEILVVSFGTSYNYSRYATVGAIERAVQEAFPDWSVRRGFTANIIIDHVQSRDGVLIDDVDAALKRAMDNGVKDLVICCTHLMEGHEYTDVINAVADVADSFEHVAISKPLFGMNDALDLDPVVNAITLAAANYMDGETAFVYMGHGTDADSDADYGALQDALTAAGYEDFYITTVESETWNTDRVIEAMKDKGYKKVVLRPLMVVAGDHAHNDMASFEEDSIRTQFEKEGYEVDCILDGLAQIDLIRDIYVSRVEEAIASLEG